MKRLPSPRIGHFGFLILIVLSMWAAETTALAQAPSSPRPLNVGALVDFVDDASGNPHFAASHIHGMMAQLKRAGVRSVSWAYYADAQGGHQMPDMEGTGNVRKVYARLGNPFAAAVRAGHERGLEVFGYFKPYEMGVDKVFPEGSPEAKAYGLFPRIGGRLAWADPFIAEHPELCIQHRSVTLPAPANANPVAMIKLFKNDDEPTRIKKDNLQIWTSADNYRYKQKRVEFQFEETIETAEETVVDIQNRVVTQAGDSVRVLTLSGLNLTDPYILVTTSLTDGKGNFVNSATRMMRCYDSNGDEIVGVYSNGSSIYNSAKADFRNWGLMFDHGYGLRTGNLDSPNRSGKTGLIAFARGRAARLGAPCETEPSVRRYWLDQIKAILDSGADGVEIRIENHSTHTDFPEEYGYNRVVLNKLDDPDNPTIAAIAKVRGDAYTEFLIAAKQMIRSRGKKMRINFELDKLCGSLPKCRALAYPANVELQWRRWIELGLPDEAVFRSYGIPFDTILKHPVTNAIADACAEKEIPIYYSRYVNRTNNLRADVEKIRSDPRFSGFVFYEVATYMKYNADGTTVFKLPHIAEAMKAAAGQGGKGDSGCE